MSRINLKPQNCLSDDSSSVGPSIVGIIMAAIGRRRRGGIGVRQFVASIAVVTFPATSASVAVRRFTCEAVIFVSGP